MSSAKFGDTVQVHYTGKLTDGEVFDTSVDREPLEFKLGEGMVIPGFENALLGMSVGDKKTVEIPVVEAYGEVQADLLLEVDKSMFPGDLELEIGHQLELQNEMGHQIPVTITNITENTVTIDANHPLAGEALIFEMELMSIV